MIKHTLKIKQDLNPMDPCDYNLGTMWCWSKEYFLGDKHARDLLVEAAYHSEHYNEVFNHFVSSGKDETFFWDDDKCLLEFVALCDDIVMTPIYIYDHGGIALSNSPFACPWDSGQVGVVFMTLDTAKRVFGDLPEHELKTKALECLKTEIALYNDYVSGQVYSYEIINEDNDVVHSCGDIYGKDQVIELALADFEYYVKKHV